MKEVVSVNLENEMDLILAHKRAMKLCELCGLSLISQTSIATAVSEIARCAIEFGNSSLITFAIDTVSNRKVLKAIISDAVDFSAKSLDAVTYAKRLVDNIEVVKSQKDFKIVLKQNLNFHGILTDSKIQSFIEYFEKEPPLSAYDELRRKNLLLQDLAEKIKESESDYRVLTDSLPLMMFSVNNRGVITYTNKWLLDFLGTMPKELSSSAWQHFLFAADYSLFMKDLNNSLLKQIPLSGEYRFKNKLTGNYIWHLISIIPLKNEKEVITRWIGFLVDIHAQKVNEQTLRDNKELKQTQEELFKNQEELQRKIVELNRSNYELEQFAHLATHDLQEPLRKLFFYSDVLTKRYSAVLDKAGITILDNMARSANRMKELINDLLSYSQLQQQTLVFEDLSINSIFDEILADLDLVIREKNALVEVAVFPQIQGNALRLRQLFTNLLTNSIKYSRKNVPPRINVACTSDGSKIIITVRDNGIGFDDAHKERIFGLFERLHTRDEFPGTGIGLSICKRIAELHAGKISARSVPNEYSVFEVELPISHS